MSIARPAASEHAPYYGKYVEAAELAVGAMQGGALLDLLTLQPVELRTLLDGVSDDFAQRAYAPGKWTLAESLIHVADAERVFSYRLLRIARGDTIMLPGFEQDEWVPNSLASQRFLADILTEIDVVRASTLALLHSLDETALARVGAASGQPVSARALAWITGGHFAHHLELTRDRYLVSRTAA